MADVEHANLTDPNLHEPKGAAAASAGQVLVADGLGGTNFQFGNDYVFGEMVTDPALTASITVSAAIDPTLNTNTDYVLLNNTNMWSTGVASNVTVNPTLGNMAVTVAGNYRTDLFLSMEIPGSTTSIIGIKYVVNGTTYSGRKIRVQKVTTGTDIVTLSAAGIIPSLSVGDTVEIHIAATDALTISIDDAGLVLELLK